RRHLCFGWWSLLLFVVMGLVLESLHGFKVRFYLDVDNQTRRLMWTLCHAHGTLLAVIHIAYGATVRLLPSGSGRQRQLVSLSLGGATLLLPVGFFLGGLFIHSGDPGMGIVLVPVGGLLLVIAILSTAWGCTGRDSVK
ncbi:MAG: hypothetical protein ACE5GE_14480, partial [Phycisphaerae bacterium]